MDRTTVKKLARMTVARVGVSAVLAVSGSAAVPAAVAGIPDAPATDPGSDSGSDSDAVTVLRQLGDGIPADRIEVPGGLVEELGYRPVVEQGYLADPEGACSSPVHLPRQFTPACRTHDLGYDLLRVVDRAGEPVPRGVRHNLDARLVERMEDSCAAGAGGTGCRIMAHGAGAALWFNTERQKEGAPVKEKLPWSW
jgi:hypothetical protein